MSQSKNHEQPKKQASSRTPSEASDNTLEQVETSASSAYASMTGAPPPVVRPDDVLTLQRTLGNRAVGTLVNQRSSLQNVVQRTPDTKRIYSEEVSYSKSLEIGKDLGYITLNEIGVTAKGEYAVKLNKASDDASTEEKTTVASDLGDIKAGIKKETKQLWHDSAVKRYSGFTPTLTKGGEVTTKGGKLAFEGAVEGKKVSFAVEFSLLDSEVTEKGIDIDVLKVSPKTKIHFIKDLPIKNGKGALNVDEEIAIGFTPNYKRIAQYIAANFSAAAAAEALFIGGSVAVVVGSLVGLCITLADADELGKIPDQVGRQIISYGRGYDDAAHEKQAGSGYYYYLGWQDGNKRLVDALASGKAPPSVIREEFAKKKFFWEAANSIKPKLKSAALKQWADTHWFDMTLDNGKGYRYLGMALDGLELTRLM
jgi:hypothetical protein